MAAIVKGLESGFVKRLHQTWRGIPESHHTMMGEMNKILEPANDYDRYHRSCDDEDGKCVPLLGEYH
jgi:hypothetical protein